jgi:hypothetical protein
MINEWRAKRAVRLYMGGGWMRGAFYFISEAFVAAIMAVLIIWMFFESFK